MPQAATMRLLASKQLIAPLARAPNRAILTSRPFPRPQITSINATSLQRSFHASRSHGEAASPEIKVKPKRRFRFLRWTWRLSYLSVIAGLGYVGYGIWIMRNPADQQEPDPSKKTLVILGKARN